MPPPRWALLYADLDPVIGSEQRGLRPVLVVSNDRFNDATNSVTILPLTSTPRRLYPSEVSLVVGAAGQPRDSIVLAHQIRTISKQRLRGMIGFLSDPSLRHAIDAAIRDHLELD